ncbi:MAG: c-type cytochrome [Gemmatimonadaceae bacterium]|nr:c-type cytochrome [Gemmatimonadaceae bacterium]
MRVSTSVAVVVAVVVVVGGVAYWWSGSHPAPPGPATSATPRIPAASPAPPPGAAAFTPPPDSAMPADEFGKEVRRGQLIFEQTGLYAKKYTGNVLTCANCHLDAGRLPNSAPLWAAYVSYPAYRSKNKHVNTFQERMQGCFRFSMNGKAPPLGDSVLVALESYAYWLATGARVNEAIAGRGYPKVPGPALPPDDARGATVFAQHCALCHGAGGQGQRAGGAQVFPPLWGPESFNWGAGMAVVNNAAGFIKANMPLGLGGTLSDQDAWDVAAFMDGHERPQDPRFAGSVEKTRALYHDSPMSRYGTTVNGVRLGAHSVAPGGSTRGASATRAPSR